jgi:hypothetical protein
VNKQVVVSATEWLQTIMNPHRFDIGS